MKEMSPDVAEKIVHSVMDKTGKSEEEVRRSLAVILTQNGITIAREPQVDLTLLSAHVGEIIVIENLRRMEAGLPYLNHRELLQEIRAQQVPARELAVVARLRAKGLPV